MKIAITGASGMIGQFLSHELAGMGHSITCLSRQADMVSSDGRIQWIVGDLGNMETCLALVRQQDVIVHLAHDGSPLAGGQGLAAGLVAGVFPSLNLIQAISGLREKPHLIFTSSGGAVYGDAAVGHFSKESDVCEPVVLYGIQKLTIERYLHYAAKCGHLRATIFRISNAYGQILPPQRMQGLIGTSISRILDKSPLRLIGNPDNTRDYIHVADIVSAIKKTLDLNHDFEIFNIGSGKGYSVRQVLELILDVSGTNLPINIELFDNSGLLPAWNVLDIDKAKRILGWQPEIALPDGISGMLAKAKGGSART